MAYFELVPGENAEVEHGKDALPKIQEEVPRSVYNTDGFTDFLSEKGQFFLTNDLNLFDFLLSLEEKILFVVQLVLYLPVLLAILLGPGVVLQNV